MGVAFDAVGVMAEILTPLVPAGISVVALSTYDTDWILVDSDRADDASDTWRRGGQTVAPAKLSGGSS